MTWKRILKDKTEVSRLSQGLADYLLMFQKRVAME